MATALTRPAGSAATAVKSTRDWASEIKTKGNSLPTRMVMQAVEKFGKTSFAAQVPGVIFGMSADETGLLTLIDAHRVRETPYLPPFETWTDLLDGIRYLTEADHNYKAFALDTLNGAEKLCHAYVCQREYGGDWGKKGFANYQQGYDVATSEWRLLLSALDRLREQRRMTIIALCHTKPTDFKNPEGPDYTRYTPAVHYKTWEITHRWADIIAFGNFYTEVVEDGNRHKGRGGQQRVLYTVRHAAYDAGNRLGLPEEIDCGNSAVEAFKNFCDAVKAAKEQNSNG